MSDDDELLLKSAAVAIEELENGIEALEKRVAKLEAQAAAWSAWGASMWTPVINTDPAA